MFIKEVAGSLYPWDLADQGVETCVDNLVEHANVNSVYLVGVMHKEKRPFTSLFYTLDPVRKYYIPEDSRIYYKVDPNNFKNTKLKPLHTERDFLMGKDWLEELTKYGRKNGLKTGAEISHTFFDTSVAKREFPDVLQKNINGGLIEKYFCSNHEDVREYMRALFYDTVKNHDVDFVQTCMMLFETGRPVTLPYWMAKIYPQSRLSNLLGVVTGGCFCDKCAAKAKQMGYDWDKIVSDLKGLHSIVNAVLHGNNERVQDLHVLLGSDLTEAGLLMEYPSLYQWLEFRMKSIELLFKDISAAIKEANKNADFRYNNYLGTPELAGLDYMSVGKYLDSVRDSDYTEQHGEPADFTKKRNTLLKIRRGLGYEKPLIAAIAIRPNANADILRQSIRALSEVGVDGLSLGHYDGSTFELLDAVKQGMKEAGMVIKP